MDVVKVVLSFDLGGYADGYAGKRCCVWVNLPMVLRRKRAELLVEIGRAVEPMKWRLVPGLVRQWMAKRRFDAAQAEMCVWLAEVWSQSDDAETHWTAKEVEELQRLEPTLYQWMVKESALLIDRWQADKKK